MSDETQAIILGMVRHLLTAVGAYAAAGGISLTGTQLDQIAGALVVLIVTGWSWWQKHSAAGAARQGAVSAAIATFETGVPVTVTVTPPGENNIATRISPTEIALAPSVPMGAPTSPPVET